MRRRTSSQSGSRVHTSPRQSQHDLADLGGETANQRHGDSREQEGAERSRVRGKPVSFSPIMLPSPSPLLASLTTGHHAVISPKQQHINLLIRSGE
ncbi:hypothetical protein E2C01_061280 [Portunus trituberculatus]|uniref:Uncharacterized protein n=1 Tax=Portunus trituberculatus TaxID=210409 RepID=A0A5B7HAA5_PORTR|nr:hypothetical protein [Portunus trituberculatus]